MKIEKTIISNLVSNEEYCRKVVPFIKAEYFDDTLENIIADELVQFFNKYNKSATLEILAVQLGQRLTGSAIQAAEDYINDLHGATENTEWLMEQTETFCKKRAIRNAIVDSFDIVEGNDKNRTEEAIPDMLQKALAVTFDTSVGHDYLEDFASRYDFYHRQEERISFGLELFDKICKGGMPKKTLNVILAGTGVGKSLFLCNLSANVLLQNKNVLYITMEMAEERIAERIDANLLNMTMHELETCERDIFESRIGRLMKKTAGRLIVKEYPTSGAHSGHFKALLSELKTKKNFIPDIIMIDYLNICASARVKQGGSVNSYSYIKSIAEELRGLAVEFNVPIVTATQTTRCLALDTVITKESGERIEIKDVKVGDKILSHNGCVEVKHVYPIERQEVYEITTKSGKKIRCSGKHIFPTPYGEKTIFGGLSAGDLLYVNNGESIVKDAISSIVDVGQQETIDISVSGDNLFLANDILTHNSGYGNSEVELTDTSECLDPTSKVIKIDGSHVELQTLKPGDRILGSNGFVSIMQVHHKKTKMMYKVKTKSGKEIICSADHIFPTDKGRICINTGLTVGTKVQSL